MKLGSKKKKYTSYSEEKKKKKTAKYVLVGVITAGITASLYQFVVVDYYCTKTRENTIKELTNDSGEYIQAFVLNKDIAKGSPITFEDVMTVTRTTEIVPTLQIKDLSTLDGMVARINLSEKTIISEDMFVKKDEEITDSIKNQDYSWITVHSFLQVGDYIDIHYKEVDGTDTIVASKKKVLNLNGNIFASNISEEERAYINNATVKTAISGGELYTSIYPDPENQNHAKFKYKLDTEIEAKIKNDPNIIKDSVDKIKENESAVNSDSINTINYSENEQVVSKPEFIGGE